LPAATVRLRVPLTRPQAVPETSAVLWVPEPDPGDTPALVLGHGAGTDMTSSVLRAVGRGLADRGHPVLVFNFAFTEAGRKGPDPMPRLESAYRDVVAVARERFGDRPLLLGGRSMGGRVASHLVAQGVPCAGLVLLGYPLHPARRGEPDNGRAKHERLRTAHWPELRVPTLFVQGDRDALADLELLEREREAHFAGPSKVHVVRGADHGFKVRKMDGRTEAEVLDEAVDAVAGWISQLDGQTAA
jgi:predicted alpha/beta-hydrolase family hydrolase